LQVESGIAVGGFYRNMSQPRSNSVDVDPRTQQMAGRGMPQGMWADTFSLKRGHHFKGSSYRAFDEGVDAKASDRLAARIEEDESIGRSFDTPAQQGAQAGRGVRTERTQQKAATLTH